MPIYVYKSKDGDTFEVKMGWSEAKKKPVIEKDGKEYKRAMQSFSPQFVGSGFHCNDYAS